MIKANLEKILKEIPKGVTLVAATKQRSIDEINQAISCGVVAVGENYLSEARKKFESIGNKVRWHFIGHLQKNKVRLAVKIFDMVETIDSLDLAVLLNRECEKAKKIMPVLIEINSAAESQKSGFRLEDVEGLLKEIINFKSIKPMGLMTMGPLKDDPEKVRPYFIKTKELFDNLGNSYKDILDWRFLSMGMSSSYKVAIEEGANIIRIGTAIFGERQ